MAAEQIELRIAVPLCAWCIGAEAMREREPDEVSHGICPRHLKKLKAQILGIPVFQSPRRAARGRERAGEPLLPLAY